MVAISVARFTVADATPGVWRRNRSIRLTHDAQVMPSIGRRSSWVAVGSDGSVDLLLGSIAGIDSRTAAGYWGGARDRRRRDPRRPIRALPRRGRGSWDRGRRVADLARRVTRAPRPATGR